MKIEFVTSYFLPFTGGIENVVLHLAEGLSDQGHTVVVHTGNTYAGNKEILPLSQEYKNFTIRRYPLYPFSLFFPKLHFVDSVVSLHNYSALMNDYVARRYPHHRKIMTPYGTITYDRSQRKYPFLSTIYDSLLGKQTLFTMDKIIAMTEFERKSIKEKYPLLSKKVITIPGGIDIFSPKKPVKQTLPAKYFLSLGRIAVSKRFEDVLLALQKFPEYHYVLAGGDNGDLNRLQQIAHEENVADRFHYIGKVSDEEKAFLMEHASVFVMPSSAEAFSLASVEAFYYGDKVVGAKSGGIVDIFEELGGKMYTAGNIGDLDIALRDVLKHALSKEEVKKRKKIIEKKYLWSSVVTRYEKAFF